MPIPVSHTIKAVNYYFDTRITWQIRLPPPNLKPSIPVSKANNGVYRPAYKRDTRIETQEMAAGWDTSPTTRDGGAIGGLPAPHPYP
jgi:hypothetical protein